MPLATFSTWTDLQARIVSEIGGRTDLTEEIKSWIWEAECILQNEIPGLEPAEKDTGDLTFPGGDESVALPADFVSPVDVQWRVTPPYSLYPVGMARLMALRGGEPGGMAAGYRIFGGNLYVAPAPSSDTTYRLLYLAGINHLGTGNETNWLTKNGASALFRTAMVVAAEFFERGSSGAQQALADPLVRALKRTVWNQKAGAGPIVMRPDVPGY